MGNARSLATARAVLRLLDCLLAEPDGLTTSEVARMIGKSTATTRYLLNSLCQEGFGVRDGQRYLPAPSIQRVGSSASGGTGHPPEQQLRDALSEVSKRTRQRAYLAVADPDTEIVDVLGHQGQPVLPGVRPTIKRQLHALAIGKVLLANLPEEAAHAYVEEQGLHAFTSATIVDPGRLFADLRQVRLRGYGLDLDERVEGFCCVAAPVFDQSGRLAGALGISATSKAFTGARDTLVRTVTEVARTASACAFAGPGPDTDQHPVPGPPPALTTGGSGLTLAD